MNIEIANRLVELRKKNNLSQEALAGKLGISRQAVSKWERAEASPDTDNLIQLARLYHVSLDELLLMGEDAAAGEAGSVWENGSCGESGSFEKADSCGEPDSFEKADSYEDASSIDTEIPCSQNVGTAYGEPCQDRREQGNEEYGRPGDAPARVIFEKTERSAPPAWLFFMEGAPLVFIIVTTYLVLGCFLNLWHPGWLLFLLLPILNSLTVAIRKKNAHYFAYPVLVSLVYLILGFHLGWWHPGWLIFLTIPVYYPMVNYIRRLIREQDKDLGL